jgi:hypothetical protein
MVLIGLSNMKGRTIVGKNVKNDGWWRGLKLSKEKTEGWVGGLTI